jgi:SagB-type dehydrogenase family enzyme
VNWQEVDIYVTTREGAYRYDARGNRLEPVRAGDFRALTGTSAWVASAPLNLVYVADLAKITRDSEDEKSFYSAIDTGFISQNVYLFCASEGLATVVRAQVNRQALAEALGLRPDQRIVVAQTVSRGANPVACRFPIAGSGDGGANPGVPRVAVDTRVPRGLGRRRS